MKATRLFLIAFIPLVAGCVSTKVDVPRDHPANPGAPGAPLASAPALPTTISKAEPTAPAHQHRHDQQGSHDQHQRAPSGKGNQ